MLRGAAVDELGAELDRFGADVLGVDAAADAVLSFEDEDVDAGFGQAAGCGEAGHSCADDQDFGFGHSWR